MCKVIALRSPEQIESLLRMELEGAERRLRDATPEQAEEASLCFRKALHQFTLLTAHGRLPRELRCASDMVNSSRDGPPV